MAKNVLVILVDQLRQDVFDKNRKDGVRIPHMRQLAEEGALFENMYCQAPLCVPTRASLLSGRYVFQHRVRDNTKLLPDNEFSYAHALRQNGYTAAFVGRSHHIDNGFQSVPVPCCDSLTFDPVKNKPFGISNFYLTGTVEKVPSSFDQRVTRTACDFMEDMAVRQPFLLQVGYLAPHNPFAIPEPYLSMYDPEKMELPKARSSEQEIPPLLKTRYEKDSWLTDADYKKAKACYYGLVTMIDDCVGVLVDKLKELGLYEDTMIVLLADHGDMLGDRGLVAKSVAYDGASKIPCIIRGGGFPAGSTVRCVTEQIDVTATILDYAGVSIPIQMQGKALQHLSGKEEKHKGYAFSQMETWRMYRDEKYKLVLYTDGYGELYDMEGDPEERENLYYNKKFADICRNMEKEMLMLYMRCEEGVDVLFPQCIQPLGAFRSGIGN